MKKNITINLFGTLYCIDEDAYTLLQKYTDNMKSYFSRQEGGEEIADDIEHRVAELMWQKKEEGNEAIDLDMIKEIIAKIGNPAEIDGHEEDTAPKGRSFEEQYGANSFGNSTTANGGSTSDNSNTSASSKEKKGDGSTWDNIKNSLKNTHLYRDPKDKSLGGVCSGLAHCYGGDPSFWRIGVFLANIALLSVDMPFWIPDILRFSIAIAYVVLWICMPEAQSPEDRLRMKGKEVTPESLNEEILRETAEESEKTNLHAAKQVKQNNNSGCLKVLLGSILLFLGFPFIIALIAVIFTIGVTAFAIGGAATGLLGDLLTSTPFEALPSLLGGMKWVIILGLISALIVCVIPIYCIIRLLRSSEKKMSAWSIVTLIVIWVLCLAFGIFGITSTVVKVAKDSVNHPEWNVTYKVTVNEDEIDTSDSVILGDSLIIADTCITDLSNDTVEYIYPDSM